MTISQQIVQSLRTESKVSNSGEEEDAIFDIDEHLRSSSKKILLQKIDFVEAKLPYYFNLKKLKSKYVLLNPNHGKSTQISTATMSPALKLNSPSVQSTSHDGIPPPKIVLFSADKVELSWKKAMRAGAGLSNLGNTCFLNSALQCLTYTAPLANYLIHLDHQKHCRVNGQFCMLCAMQQQLYYIHSNSGQAIKPMYILKNLRMIAKHLQFGRQEDAHEFIRYSVDAMQKACLFGYSSKIDVHIRATTAVHQIFGGYLRSRVRCMQCKSVSDMYEPFLDLSLDISKQGCVNLQRCLEMFVRAEVLQGDNAYKCMQCKNSVQAYKKFSIHRPPNVLTLQLKRFSNFVGNKINKDLTYPSKLNIEPYMSNKSDGGYWYELYAVLVHSGFSCQSGHYYAYAKAPNGQWHCFNDSTVHQVGVNQALSQQAYLLFYSRNPKAPVQSGNLKQSLNKNLHSSPANSKVHPSRGSSITNGNGKAETQELIQRPRIGPKLPANFKRDKDYSFQSTSSGKGFPVDKQCNQPKVIPSLSAPRPSCSVNSDRKPLQFSLNKKSKLANITSSTPKLTNGGQNHSSTTMSCSSAVQNSNQKSPKIETKSSTLTGTNSSGLRSPVLDRFLKDSSEPGTSASSASMSRSSLPASSVSNGGSKGFKPLVSYSSEDSDDDNDYDVPLQSDYTSLTSTLKKLRGEIVSPPNNKISPLTIPRKENVVEKDKNATKSGLKNTESKSPSKIVEIVFDKHDDHEKGDKAPSNRCTKKPELVKSGTKGAFDIVNFVSGPARTNLSCLPQGGAAVNVKQEKTSQREPILHLLNNEIKNGLNGEESRGKFKVKNTKENDVSHLAERILDTKKDDEIVKENECSKLGDRILDHKNLSKERKPHHSAESTSVASPQKENKCQNKHHMGKPQKRSPSPMRHVFDRKSETPTKKRKTDKSDRSHYSDGYDSDESYRGRREKHHKSRKEVRESPLRRKKHERKELNSTLEGSFSKTNGKSPENGGSNVEKLYCDKQELEQSLRRKSKKDKKRRLKERQILQHSINKESPKYDRHRSLSCERQRGSDTNGTKEAHEHSHDSSISHGAKRHHEHSDNHHHDKKAKKEKNYENGKVHKKDEKRDCDDRKSATKDRPNILQQLLKQSSGKAYGAKVSTWNGEESLVEKDAQRTWSELHTPLTDEWDREYDKGKVKKHKKKDHYHHKMGAIHNIFQKFQNMKNQRNGE